MPDNEASTTLQDSRPIIIDQVSVGEAVRRYPIIAAIPVLILAVLGVALGLHRQPTYTANSQVVVEPLAPTVVQLPGAIQAAQDVATNQSRLIDSDGVTDPLATQFHITSKRIASRLSATPIPSSTVIRIGSESNTAHGAIALANAAAEEFSRYATAQLQTNTSANKMLQSYTTAALAYRRALLTQQRLTGSASKQVQVEVGAALDAAQLRRQALSQQYEDLIQSHSTAPTVTPFVLATSAISDRSSKLEAYVFAGILIGLLIGIALVTLIANRRSSRDMTA